MIRAFRRTCFLALTLAVTACAGLGADWSKPGASRDDVRADNAYCRGEAEAVIGREAQVTHDIRSGGSSGPSDVRVLSEQTRDIGMERRYDSIFERCMRSRGYTRAAQ